MLNCCYVRRFVHNIVLDSVVHRSACRRNRNQRNQMISPTRLNHPLRLQHERAPTVRTCEEDRDQLISPQHRTQPSLQSHQPLPIVTTTRSSTKFFNAENSGAHHRQLLWQRQATQAKGNVYQQQKLVRQPNQVRRSV